MPLFGFRCVHCKREFDLLLRSAPKPESEQITCPDCGSLALRIFPSPARAMTHSTPGFFNTDSRL